MKKKILSLLMVLVLALSMLPMAAFATEDVPEEEINEVTDQLQEEDLDQDLDETILPLIENEKDLDLMLEKTTLMQKLTIVKEWADADTVDHSKDSVTVDILDGNGDKVGEPVVLNADNDWTVTVMVPVNDVYTVVEQDVDGYTASYVCEYQDKAVAGLTFDVAQGIGLNLMGANISAMKTGSIAILVDQDLTEEEKTAIKDYLDEMFPGFGLDNIKFEFYADAQEYTELLNTLGVSKYFSADADIFAGLLTDMTVTITNTANPVAPEKTTPVAPTTPATGDSGMMMYVALAVVSAMAVIGMVVVPMTKRGKHQG